MQGYDNLAIIQSAENIQHISPGKRVVVRTEMSMWREEPTRGAVNG